LAARIRRMGGRSRVRRSHLDVQLISADGIILDEKSIRLPSRFLRRYRTVYVDFDAVSSVGSTIKIVQRRGSSCSGEQNSAKSTTSSC
jgi:hypothetical protein